MNKALSDLLRRAEHWPAFAQGELVQIAQEIERELQKGPYRASAEELEAIDEADRSDTASPEDVRAAFTQSRRE